MATPVRRIVDTSPLILLAKVGQLDLLRAGVPEILVPDAVLQEVAARGPTDPVFQEIQRVAWLKIVPCASDSAASAGLEPRCWRELRAHGGSDRSGLRSDPRRPRCATVCPGPECRIPRDGRPGHPGEANRYTPLGPSRG